MTAQKSVSDDSQQCSRNSKDFKPGDQIFFTIPSNPGGTRRVWGYVMKKTSKQPDAVIAVIDEILMINAPPKYHCGAVVSVNVSDIIAHIPVGPEKPMLHVDIQCDSLMNIKRVDGSSTPVIVAVDQDEYSCLYIVDHTGMQPIEDHENQNHQQQLLF